MIQSLFRSTLTFAVAAAATVVIVAASAAPVTAAEVPHTAVIDIRGIDLTSADGHARVTAEVARAARRLCDTSDNRNLAIALANRSCVADTIASATLPQVNLAAASVAQVADAALPTNTVRR